MDSGAIAWVAAHVESGLLPTAVLGTANRDGIQEIETFGAVAPDDPFALFSITKPLLGMVALRHLETGALSLDTPLAQAVPEFGADRDDVVRLRHLVTHSAGIPEPALDAPIELDEALLAPGRLFAAGSAWYYSSVAFRGLARLVEMAGGEPWEDQLTTLVRDVGAGGISMDTARAAHPPVVTEEAPLDWDRFCALRHPGAGAVGTAEDLLRVGVSLLRDDQALVSSRSRDLMRTRVAGEMPPWDPALDRPGCDWGFTWAMRRAVPRLDATDGFGHAGWAGTELWIHPDHDLTYVLLTNAGAAEARGLDPVTLARLMTRGGAG